MTVEAPYQYNAETTGAKQEATNIRSDPADPREVRKGTKEIPGEEVPAEGEQASVGEEPFTRDSSTVALARVLRLMQGVEQRRVHQVGRPD